MTYASTVQVAPAAIVTQLVERVRAVAVEAHRRSVARRQYRRLLNDDHLREDIGVSRGEVREAMRRL